MTFEKFKQKHPGGYAKVAAPGCKAYRQGRMIYGDTDSMKVVSWSYDPLNGVYTVHLK